MFFSEGVSFSGLLNQTGECVSGCEPDERIQDWKRKQQDGWNEGGGAEMLCYFLCICRAYGSLWLGYTSADMKRPQVTSQPRPERESLDLVLLLFSLSLSSEAAVLCLAGAQPYWQDLFFCIRV